MRCADGLLADVHKAVIHTGRSAEKEHTLKSPVRKIDNLIMIGSRMGQHVAKIIVGDQIGVDPAKFAGKQTISFL
jgi:hypothetical protein